MRNAARGAAREPDGATPGCTMAQHPEKAAMNNFADQDRKQAEWAERAYRAQAAAAQAIERLLDLAETRDSGQIRTVAHFIAATFDGQTFPFDLFDLRTVDVDISDDMLLCLDALRWGKADLFKLVPNGEQRILAICKDWGFEWPDR